MRSNAVTRLYLINSPVVRAEPLRFAEKGVRDVIKDVFLPWFNAYRFLVQSSRLMQMVKLWLLCCCSAVAHQIANTHEGSCAASYRLLRSHVGA